MLYIKRLSKCPYSKIPPMKSSWLHTYTCQFITILAFFGWILPTELCIRSSLNLLHFAKDALIKEFQRDLKFLVNLFFNSWNFGFRTKNHKSLNFRTKQLRICKLSTITFLWYTKTQLQVFFSHWHCPIFYMSKSQMDFHFEVVCSWFNFLSKFERCILLY